MDLIHRKSRYHELIRQSGSTKSPLPSEIPSHSLQEEINYLITIIRPLYTQRLIQLNYAILTVPLVIILFIHSISHGIGLSFIYLILILCYFIAAQMTLKHKALSRLRSNPISEKNTNHQFLQKKLQYTWDNLMLKSNRLFWCIGFYLLFFPALLTYSFAQIMSGFIFGSEIVTLGLAYAISSGLWGYYFYPNITEVLSYQKKMNKLNQSLTSMIS